MAVREFVAKWPSWLKTVALVGSAFGICGFCQLLIAVARYYEDHPELQDRLVPCLLWAYGHWWLVPGLVALGVVAGLVVWFRRWVRWAPKGLISWARWHALQGDLRSRLERLSVGACELLVAAVRVGKPWHDPRVSVGFDEAVSFINLRRRRGGHPPSWRLWLARGWAELDGRGLVSYRQRIGEEFFVVSFSRGVKSYGSSERLADLVEMRLVLTGHWKP